MTDLVDLQKQFQKFIVSGDAGIHQSIVETERVSVDTRLAIYRDAYKLRLIESLSISFPALYAYLGTEAFQELCSDYIDAHPSSYRSIRWYGDVLAAFVKSYYDKRYAYLAELVDFEWKMTLVFDAADDKVLLIEEMAQVPPELWGDMTFRVHPSVQRLNYFWNAIPLWQTLVSDQDLPALHCDDQTTPWVVWRLSDYRIQFYSLSAEEAWMLDAALDGLTFGALCEGLCQWVKPEDVGMKAATYLKNWIQKGMLSQLIMTNS